MFYSRHTANIEAHLPLRTLRSCPCCGGVAGSLSWVYTLIYNLKMMLTGVDSWCGKYFQQHLNRRKWLNIWKVVAENGKCNYCTRTHEFSISKILTTSFLALQIEHLSTLSFFRSVTHYCNSDVVLQQRTNWRTSSQTAPLATFSYLQSISMVSISHSQNPHPQLLSESLHIVLVPTHFKVKAQLLSPDM